MNIEKYKTGIKIKKSNRGKFTSYCGGKVTSACILKGKNSSDPAVRKRATFAANARTWKHQLGGMLTQTDLTPWIRHKTFEEFDSLGRKLYNRYDSTYIADMMEDGGKVEKGQEGLTAKNDNTRVVKPFHMSPIKSVKNPKQAYISSILLDEMDRRNLASKQRQYHELLYKDLHLWNIDPTRKVNKNNVGFTFNVAGIQGQPIRLGMTLAIGSSAVKQFPKIINGIKNEALLFKQSFNTTIPIRHYMNGLPLTRLTNTWVLGTKDLLLFWKPSLSKAVDLAKTYVIQDLAAEGLNQGMELYYKSLLPNLNYQYNGIQVNDRVNKAILDGNLDIINIFTD